MLRTAANEVIADATNVKLKENKSALDTLNNFKADSTLDTDNVTREEIDFKLVELQKKQTLVVQILADARTDAAKADYMEQYEDIQR